MIGAARATVLGGIEPIGATGTRPVPAVIRHRVAGIAIATGRETGGRVDASWLGRSGSVRDRSLMSESGRASARIFLGLAHALIS